MARGGVGSGTFASAYALSRLAPNLGNNPAPVRVYLYSMSRFCLLLSVWICLSASAVSFAQDLPPPAAAVKLPGTVWKAKLEGFSLSEYEPEVEALLARFEDAIGHRLVPGEKGRVGLKIYADAGPGLATPVPLVQAVIGALIRRGYEKKDVFLVGLNSLRLRLTGYLPSLITGEFPFEGHKIYVLESGSFYDPEWFYDSPWQSRFDPVFLDKKADRSYQSNLEENRRSFLATPLFLDADIWVNLPVYTDHPTLGINGALVNATLWNASNTARFFNSATSGPVAVAEMSAIPELRQTWLFTIASLQHYQFIGGPAFNSLYTVSDREVWLSTDPVALDTLMLEKINRHRRNAGFPIVSEEIRTLEFAEVLAVGSLANLPERIIRVD
ncbi:MAG: DUF362 domain-containing protein [Candidatus Synoicihabitans palmerolidicus]|nr:DUF362 domain-containing protein [Candidatus Synoicihabitans palmerolidicus]